MTPKKKASAGRHAALARKTRETDIRLTINLDGKGLAQVSSGVGFFDHMLEALAKHGALDLEIRCEGDTHIDDHHSVEDVGIVLGTAVKEALGDKAGIRRFGFASVPLDEALSQVTIDLSGRAHFAFRGRNKLGRGKIGSFDVELLEDFLGAFASAAGATLHAEVRAGRNTHHIVEATFKAFARALRQAIESDPRIRDVPSTKGVL
ncbi:MAG: imidazoleglycerol-phosphate dehydratase HisB [Planctomycetota bacterium]|nr:imidazoleglycerol-phosphate dehydratase HisB [Planctomycetota bacterium]